MDAYFKLRCVVVELFYESLLEERYSVGQAADRCLVELQGAVQGGGRNALVVLSVLLSRVARREPAALARFTAETSTLRTLGEQAACWRGLQAEERERLQEDLRFVLEKV